MLGHSRGTSDRRRRAALASLGLVTIVVYGACYYAFGAFIAPISVATGWPQGTLGVVFAGVLVLNGGLAVVGGRLVDRRGPRTALVTAGTLGAGAMFVSSVQSSLAGFAITYVVGCGLVGAMAYYHVTQPTAARAGARPERAIVRLTIFGAFAAPVYLPLTEVLVHAIGWRSALRAEAGTVSFACLAAAAVVSGGHPVGNRSALGRVSSALRGAWGQPGARRWVLAVLIGTAATDLMLTYQVAIMVAFGLSATVAASVAGLRGLAQLGGRLPLGAVLRHWGVRPALVVAHLVALASAGALLFSGHLWAAVAFTVLAGISLGAITSLQGLYTKELIDPKHFGALFGALQGVIGIGGAAGPALGGLVLDLGGSHRLLVVVMTVGLAVAVVVLATGPSRLAGRGSTHYRRWTMVVDRDRAELFASWFRCLADPTRIQILSLLATERRPMAVGEIVAAMDVGQSTVSEHLRRLAETCFVHVEHRGTASLFLINERCIECLPSAAELVMGEVEPEALPAPRPGATSRRARHEARRLAVTT